MNNLLTTTSDSDNDTGLPKWQQPEKMAGRVVLVGLIGAAVYFWGAILPSLVDIVFNSVKLGIGLGVLFVLFLLATNKRIQAGLWYAGQRILRTLAGIFVNTDPIGIMQDYIKNTEQEARKMDAEVTNIEGAHELVKRKLAANTDQMKEYLSLASSATRQGEKDMAEGYASRAAQLEDYNRRLQPMQLADVIGYATQTVRPQLDDKQLRLDLQVPDTLPAVQGDIEKTTRVLINLLANAIRYSPAAAPLTIRAVQWGEMVRVSVEDHGLGISPEYHKRILSALPACRGTRRTAAARGWASASLASLSAPRAARCG